MKLIKSFASITKESNKSGGGTFDAITGFNYKDSPLYAVAILPQRTKKIWGKTLFRIDISEFYVANADLLLRPRLALGIWYNEKDGHTYMDVVALVGKANLTDAANLARYNNQICFYDLGENEVLYVGGTGKGEVDETIVLDIIQKIPAL
jgi:hypothetical protein